jgi:YD repeat-containing protein
MRTSVLLLAVTSLVCFEGLALGQVNPGIPPFAAFDSHEVDSVDLMNNNVILRVPVMSKQNAIDFGVAANSYMWSSGTWTPSMSTGVNSVMGAPFTPAAYGMLGASTYFGWTASQAGPPCYQTYPQTPTTILSGFYIVMADGTRHPVDPTLGILTGAVPACNSSMTTPTIDGSGLTLSVVGYSQGNVNLQNIYLRNGSTLSTLSLIDSNGNSLLIEAGCGSTCKFQDLMGLTALTESTPNGITKPQYSWTDVNGGSPSVNQSTTNLTLKTNFGCSGITELNNSFTTAMTTGFSFPDGTSVGLTYEGTPGSSGKYTGRINKITQREGGTAAYTYGGSNNGIDCTYQTVPVLTRTLGDGETTTYTLAHSLISGSNYKATNTVVDNGGNKTVYTFTGFTSSGTNAPPVTQALTEVQRYQGSSTLLTTDVYCYNATLSSCSFSSAPTATVQLPVTSLVVKHQINGMSNTSATETHYDTYGNITYTALYDFGATSPTLATTTTYGTWNGTACVSIGNNVNGTRCDVLTQAVSTTGSPTVAEQRYAYDSHGNLLTTYVWTGSTWLSNSTPNVYNSNGTPSRIYDLANNETFYEYSSSGYLGCSSCTNFPYPTSALFEAGGPISTVWYGVAGVKSSVTDNNGAVTTYGYTSSGGSADPFWRVMSVTDALGNEAWNTYPSGSSPDSLSGTFTFNSGNSIQNAINTSDGYGRTINVQSRQSPSATSYDTVSTTFGWSGNYSTIATSQPCSATAGSSCTAVHTNYYDPLGRLYKENTSSNETVQHTYTQNDDLLVVSPAPSGENNKQTQNQYDGLGRLQYSCAIGNGSSSACAQNTGSANGVTTSVSYAYAAGSGTASSTRGSQSRSQTFDALNRVTQVVTPEGGTHNNYYDSYGSCPAGYIGASGQLTARKDPNGNLLCFAYDGMNRVIGENANGTACRHFYYDNGPGYSGTIPTGITLNNSYRRLVEAATDACSANTLITDEWFSYDKDGNMTDMWEKTPHSGQYYHSIATFAGNGVITSLQLASPSLYTMTYGLDGEGRWDTLTDTTLPQNIVTGPTTVGGMYDPAGHVLNVQLTGNTPDQDIYTYDPNTGNMKTFEFEVGNTPANLTGTITWNPNGTVGHVAVVDGFNAGGTSTCYSDSGSWLGYGYDDWGRLNAFDCGNGSVGQYYTYDQYDNLTTNVAPATGRTGWTWAPGYSSSTNQCTGCLYDANGDMTSDGSGSNSFQWNEFSKLKSWIGSGTPTCGTSGKCITYDAFGRAVEFSSGSTWTETWYSQVGKVGMSGATLSYAYWPSPGRGAVVVNGTSTFTFMHQDWLGNDRVVSSINNHTEIADRDYTPYGGQQFNAFGSTNPVYGMYAEITGDFNAGVLWDTPNRELAVSGRWLSPDPAGAGWNQYAYATNPLALIDPLGLDCIYLDDTGENVEEIDSGSCGESDGGYYIPGLVDPSSIVINSDAGTIMATSATTGWGFVTSIAGAFGSNAYGQWTYTPQNVSTMDSSLLPPLNYEIPIVEEPGNPGPNIDEQVANNNARSLGQAVNATGVQTLESPCFVPGFYAASAIPPIAVGFAGVTIPSAAVFPAFSETLAGLGPAIATGTSWLSRAGQLGVRALGAVAGATAGAINSVCG